MSQEDGAKKRRWKNFLLLPRIQIKLAVYMILLAAIFFVGGSWIVYSRLEQAFTLILDLTELEDEVTQMLAVEIQKLGIVLAALVAAYVGTNLCLSVFFTHRMIGPIQAFRRHVNQLTMGNYNAKTALRKHDAFEELAEDLNRLSHALREKK
ncbi:MAG: hypothetical protein OXT67_05240 [Zetaproteobacteria bacterium]|nr:hypothetical protein [Zetaproteobacteria bacterium]